MYEPQTIAAVDVLRQPAPILSIVVPTFNELGNIEPLLALLHNAMLTLPYEVIFVDDRSTDDTARLIKSLARSDMRVRCIERIGRRGLSSAVVEGILSSSADFVAVIDADLQHDETLLPHMLDLLQTSETDVVIGSRYVEGGGLGEWEASRVWMSKIATRLASAVMPQKITDPMSGFFMTRRELFEEAAPHLSVSGYKILLDYLASSPRTLKCAELPYTFRLRQSGDSKLDSLVLWEYAMLLIDKLLGGYVPARFVMFSLVGGLGVAVHMLTLKTCFEVLQTSFQTAQINATVIAMVINFVLNNRLTYLDKRLTGVKMFTGLLSFMAVCSVGAFANVGIASYIFKSAYQWWVAGLAGILVGTVFNYTLTSLFTWRKR